ncbi:MAG TPA: FlgD immunoglobulin-like domain containing protein [Candidatus Latescibacteria bacterium]|nr:FlgD immunoglobulin-like domain containing protein [Candidatus Latescibacterota bacterium]
MRPRILALFLAGVIAASAIPVRAQVLPPDSSVTVPAFTDIVAGLQARLLALRDTASARGDSMLLRQVDLLSSELITAQAMFASGDILGAQVRISEIAAKVRVLWSSLAPLPPPVPIPGDSVVILPPYPGPPLPPIEPVPVDIRELVQKAERLIVFLRGLATQQGDTTALAIIDRSEAIFRNLLASGTLADDEPTRATLWGIISTLERLLGQLQPLPPPVPPDSSIVIVPPYPGLPYPPPDSVIIMPPFILPDSAAIAGRLDHIQAFLDSAVAVVRSEPNLPASEMIPRAYAVVDSARDYLSEGAKQRAFDLATRAGILAGRIREAIAVRARVETGVDLVRQHADSLALFLSLNPNARASEALAPVSAMLDSVRLLLDEGRVFRADAVLQRAREHLRLAHEMIALEAKLRRMLGELAQRIERVGPIVEASGDTVALALFERAKASADSAGKALDEGAYRRAGTLIEASNMALDRALFIATAPDRIAGEIAALRTRIARLLSSLPATAVRERAIVMRASALVDSAQVALNARLYPKAEQMLVKVRYALDTLLRTPIIDPVIPPVTTLPLDSLVTLARQWVAQAVVLNDSARSDSVRVVLEQVVVLLDQVSAALADGNREEAVSLANNALILAASALRTARAELVDDWSSDPVVKDLIAAGEEAERAVQTPTEVDKGTTALQYTLKNTPNPFNPSTTVRYTLGATERVNLAVYNMLGQEMRVLVRGVRSAGSHEATWDGRDANGIPLASGIYFARLQTESTTLVIRMVLSR